MTPDPDETGAPPPAAESRFFAVLVREHHRRLLAYALALAPARDQAEDLVQEAFLAACRGWRDFDPARDFGAWLRGIIRNKFRERARAWRRAELTAADLAALEGQHSRWDEAARAGRGEALAALRGCLEGLGASLRQAVELFYREGLSCAAAAARLETTEAGVKKRLQRARELLAGCLRAKLEPSP